MSAPGEPTPDVPAVTERLDSPPPAPPADATAQTDQPAGTVEANRLLPHLPDASDLERAEAGPVDEWEEGGEVDDPGAEGAVGVEGAADRVARARRRRRPSRPDAPEIGLRGRRALCKQLADIAPRMLENAARLVAEAGFELETRLFPAEKMPFATASHRPSKSKDALVKQD